MLFIIVLITNTNEKSVMSFELQVERLEWLLVRYGKVIAGFAETSSTTGKDLLYIQTLHFQSSPESGSNQDVGFLMRRTTM